MKLLAGFGVVVAMMVLVGSLAIERLGMDNAHLDLLAAKVVPSTRVVGDIDAIVNTYRKDQFHYIVATPAARAVGAPGSISGDLRSDMVLVGSSVRLLETRGLAKGERDRALLGMFRSEFSRYVKLTSSFRSLADAGHLLQAGAVVGAGARDLEWDRIKALMRAWSDHEVATAVAADSASSASYDFSLTLILALLASATAVALALAVTFARRTTRALRAIGAAASAISRGELDQHIEVRSSDELGELAGHFAAMVEYLRSTVAIRTLGSERASSRWRFDRAPHPTSSGTRSSR